MGHYFIVTSCHIYSVYLWLGVSLFKCLSVWVCVCDCVRMLIGGSVCMWACFSVSSLTVSVSLCPCVGVFIGLLFGRLSVCMSVHLPIYLCQAAYLIDWDSRRQIHPTLFGFCPTAARLRPIILIVIMNVDHSGRPRFCLYHPTRKQPTHPAQTIRSTTDWTNNRSPYRRRQWILYRLPLIFVFFTLMR